MKRVLIVLFLAVSIFQAVSARSDDITLMGNVSPLFYLNNGFSETVITSGKTELTVEVSDIAVNAAHIFVRFFISDLPSSMKAGVTDDTRIYGSYLPTAEIFTAEGTHLTPSSASRYSLLEYNSRLIIGGLLVFDTDQVPQTFYLNFNQIPFDTQPLAEGFSKAVILSPAKADGISRAETASSAVNDLEFLITSAAQTNEFTMLQPSVRMERPDESLTKFGWITFRDTADRKKFAVTRGNLYGFNLTDDSLFSPAHAYVFSPVTSETPIQIIMDNVYVRRSFEKPYRTGIDLKDGTDTLLTGDKDFHITITETIIFEKDEKIRLYISAEDQTISDISFSFPGIIGPAKPSVTCGIDTQSDRFACDLYFIDTELPETMLDVEVGAIEYRKDGPWSITWTPVPMDISPQSDQNGSFSFPTVSGRRPQEERGQSDAVKEVLDAIDLRSKELTSSEGWIHESFQIKYQFHDDYSPDLIPVDQAGQYYTDYLSGNWYRIDHSGQIIEQLTVLRDPETDSIFSAQQMKDNSLLDLVHTLLVQTDNKPAVQYRCFEDFTGITGSAAVFSGESECEIDGETCKCLDFYQALNGVAGSTGSQNITFYVYPEDKFIKAEVIDYDLGALTMTKITRILERTETLPDDILQLIGSVK